MCVQFTSYIFVKKCCCIGKGLVIIYVCSIHTCLCKITVVLVRIQCTTPAEGAGLGSYCWLLPVLGLVAFIIVACWVYRDADAWLFVHYADHKIEMNYHAMGSSKVQWWLCRTRCRDWRRDTWTCSRVCSPRSGSASRHSERSRYNYRGSTTRY